MSYTTLYNLLWQTHKHISIKPFKKISTPSFLQKYNILAKVSLNLNKIMLEYIKGLIAVHSWPLVS